jgi:hypothetical protein
MRFTNERWFLWRIEWYSICSRHHHYNHDCELGNTGRWVSVLGHKISHTIYKTFPKLWVWWVNRPKKERKRSNLCKRIP